MTTATYRIVDVEETVRIPFNTFCHLAPVLGDREAFWNYCQGALGDTVLITEDEWWFWWDQFCKTQDARDEHDTQRDALA